MDTSPYRRAIEAHFPQIQVRTVALNQEGWSSLVLEVNGAYIFRFPRRPEIEAGSQKEIALLPHLQQALPVQIPQFEFIYPGAADGESPFVGYRRIPGVPLDAALAANPGIARHIGETLTILHNLALPWSVHRCLPLRSILDWKRQYLDLYQFVRRQVLPMLDEGVCARVIDLWEGFLRQRANFRFKMALIHADLGREHILCDPVAQRVNGIIDWEDACTGDPALDFVGLLHVGGAPFVRQVLQSYQRETGPNFWQRLDFYHAITPFYSIQYGLQVGDETHIRSALDELQRTND